jgi:type III secretory pathway component EscT
MTSLLNWQQSINGRSFTEAYAILYLIAGGIAVLAGAIVNKKQSDSIDRTINVDSNPE